MDSHKISEILVFCFSGLQGLAAAIYIAKEIWGWLHVRKVGKRKLVIHRPVLLIVLILGCLATAGVGFWLVFHPPTVGLNSAQQSIGSANPSPQQKPKTPSPQALPTDIPKETGKQPHRRKASAGSVANLPNTQPNPTPAQTTYEQKCDGSACAQGPGSQATFNQYGSSLPKVTASAQRQVQTGKADAPWETVFTISTNVLVQTGDLRLKCSGPVIMAGISRINPASLNTGYNGPNPHDPNEAIYQLGPEMLSPGQIVKVAVYSRERVNVLSGSIGPNAIIF
jgi:hypothetical protein